MSSCNIDKIATYYINPLESLFYDREPAILRIKQR